MLKKVLWFLRGRCLYRLFKHFGSFGWTSTFRRCRFTTLWCWYLKMKLKLTILFIQNNLHDLFSIRKIFLRNVSSRTRLRQFRMYQIMSTSELTSHIIPSNLPNRSNLTFLQRDVDKDTNPAVQILSKDPIVISSCMCSNFNNTLNLCAIHHCAESFMVISFKICYSNPKYNYNVNLNFVLFFLSSFIYLCFIFLFYKHILVTEFVSPVGYYY